MTSAVGFGVLAVFTSFTGLLLLPKPSNGSLQSIFNYSNEINGILRLSQVRLPQIAASSKVSEACKQAVKIVETSLKLSSHYMDAFGKPQSAILLPMGNNKWLGSYSECTGIIPGAHYCLTHISVSLFNKAKSDVRWGVCVPQACSEADVTEGLSNAFTVLNTLLKGTVFALPTQASPFEDTKPVVCAKPSEYTTGVILTLILCGSILFLVLVGTVVDLTTSFLMPRSISVNKTGGFMPARDQSIAADSDGFPYFSSDGISSTNSNHLQNDTSDVTAGKNPNVLVRFLMCFSLIQNTIRIMDTNVPPGAITSINGMRVLSMWWVILGHTYLVGAPFASNIFLAPKFVHRFTFQTVVNATFSVDSFFFLSGLLVSYLSLRQMERNDGKLPLFKFYFHRFWRLTPTYMFVLLFHAKLNGFLGQGPVWYKMQSNEMCDQYWWTNLLYINNFYPITMGHECMAWTWYLAIDMQFFIISPIVIYAAYRFRLVGLLVTTGSLLCASFVATALIIYHFDLDVSFLGQLQANAEKDPQSLMYDKPYCRIAPYLIGMFLGYVFHVKHTKIRLVYLFNAIGWCVAIVLALSTLYGEYKVLRKHQPKPFNEAENITYGTFSRFAWSLALAWVIYACHRGLGGLVDKILSARFWIPLSRLTYSAYLVHLIAIIVFFHSMETLWTLSDVQTSFYFVAMVMISYAAAFIVAVCVEFPMMQLEKLIFKTDR